MTHAVADALALVSADIPPALVSPAALGGLNDLAAALPAVVRCGFEVHLAAGGEVDFQQGIVADPAEQRALGRYLRRTEADGTARVGVAALLERWQDPQSALHEAIDDVWLEFDDRRRAALSVFVGFTRAPGPAAERFGLASAAAELLGGTGLSAVARRCFDACPPGAFVSHVGLMSGRPAPFVRINVKRLPPPELAAYLAGAGWPGDIDEATALAQELRGLADGVTLCLDVGAVVHPRLGFEAHAAAHTRWLALLDALVARGCCTPAKRDALLAWPGTLTPSSARSWPASLARDALMRSADHFTAIERVISHVKLVLSPRQPVDAKGYFGFEHRWLRPGLDRAPAGRSRAVAPRGVAAAVAFLLEARTRSGWWRDFAGTFGAHEDWSASQGYSDEYVTAYVAAALAVTGEGALAREAAAWAWALLERRRVPTAGWGWNRLVPVDADSTSWGLRLAEALGASGSSVARAARRALVAHRMPDGGMSSYRAGARPRPGARALTPPDGSYAGWTASSHACVTAAAAGLGDAGALAFLRAAQRDDGSWASYWWLDDEFATALAARALAATGDAADRARAAEAAGWAAARVDADGSVSGSPFATALAVQAIGSRHATERSRALAWLAERQQDDGGWPASSRLVAPRPDLVDRTRSPLEPMGCLDDARAFTTATVLVALRGRER